MTLSESSSVRLPPELVVCSLEPWSEVRRRIRLLTEQLIDLDPHLRVLFVEPPADVPHAILRRRWVELRHRAGRWETPDRVRVLRPHKWWPRLLGPFADRGLTRQVINATRALGMKSPVLWVNDAHYARLVTTTGWPSLYDITDDWTKSSITPRERRRLHADEETLFEECAAVVVCSPELARTKGKHGEVTLIPNGVDVTLFRSPAPRPSDLPPAPVVLYPGTLHEDRLDIDLCVSLARSLPEVRLVFLGPNSLSASSTLRLRRLANVVFLGARPYEEVPGYLQHCDVLVVPHRVTPFTESLDPIKAYECLAVGRPTVATPVAGFRDLGPPVVVVPADQFVDAVGRSLANAARGGGSPSAIRALAPPHLSPTVVSWRDRAESFARTLADVWENGRWSSEGSKRREKRGMHS